MMKDVLLRPNCPDENCSYLGPGGTNSGYTLEGVQGLLMWYGRVPFHSPQEA